MNLRISKALACLCFAAATALAQAEDPPFWKERGQVTKDDAGRVIFAEERDPTTYTVRMFSVGVWRTLYYKPHTTQVLKMETPDTVEEPLYDQHGNYKGVRIRFNGVVLELHSEGLGKVLDAAGLGPIAVEKDRGGRISRIHDTKGMDLARFHFDQKGYLRSLEVGSRTLELSAPIDGNVQETLKADGRVVARAMASGTIPNAHFLGSCLDAVRQQLNLPEDWQKGLTFRRSTTGTVTTTVNADGKPLFYMVTDNGNRFGFDTAGKPLFVDVSINLAYGTAEHEADTGPAINEQSAVAPDHIVVTSDGRIGACRVGAAAGAIASFWTERMPNGATVTRYRTYGLATPKTNSAVPQPQNDSRKSIPPLRTTPNFTYLCDAETTCMIGPDWCECNSCTTNYYYCESDTGGGGTSSGGGGTTGGGSGSSGYASNTVTDATLRTKVDAAIKTAASKLANCGSSLTSLMALNGQSLGTWLAGKAGGPWSMATFIQGGPNSTGQMFQMDTASNPNGYCAAGAPAYTLLYQNTTFVCQQQFLSLTSSEQWVRLIHEELHALGYPENPPTAWAQSPAQISAMVAQRCP